MCRAFLQLVKKLEQPEYLFKTETCVVCCKPRQHVSKSKSWEQAHQQMVTLTFDLLTLNSCHTWRVTWSTLPPSLKTLRLFFHWVTTYNGSHWLALKMRTRPLRMRRITWPVNRGSKTITYLESLTPIWLHFTSLAYWPRPHATM